MSVDWYSPATYFGVGGQSVLMDPPEPCPRFPRLQVVGIVGDEASGRCLVVAVGSVYSFLGPTRADVARRAFMLASTIVSTANLVSTDAIGEIVDWLIGIWQLAGGEGGLDPWALDDQERLWLAELERELFSS